MGVMYQVVEVEAPRCPDDYSTALADLFYAYVSWNSLYTFFVHAFMQTVNWRFVNVVDMGLFESCEQTKWVIWETVPQAQASLW